MGRKGVGHLLTKDIEVVMVSIWNLCIQIWVRRGGGRECRDGGNLERWGRGGEGGGKKNRGGKGRGKGGSQDGGGKRGVGDGGETTGCSAR